MVMRQLSARARRAENVMETPEDVAVMLQLHEAGWWDEGHRRAAGLRAEHGPAVPSVGRVATVRGWGGAKALDDHQAFVERSFDQHCGNAEVVRQELAKEGVAVSLRTVERAVEERRRLRAARVADSGQSTASCPPFVTFAVLEIAKERE